MVRPISSYMRSFTVSQHDLVLFCCNCFWPWLVPQLERSPLLPCQGQEGFGGQGVLLSAQTLPVVCQPSAAFGEKQPHCLIRARKGPRRAKSQLWSQREGMPSPCTSPSGAPADPGLVCNSLLSTNEDYPCWAQELCEVLAPLQSSGFSPGAVQQIQPRPALTATHPGTTGSFLVHLFQGDTRSCFMPVEKGCPAAAAGPVKPSSSRCTPDLQVCLTSKLV